MNDQIIPSIVPELDTVTLRVVHNPNAFIARAEVKRLRRPDDPVPFPDPIEFSAGDAPPSLPKDHPDWLNRQKERFEFLYGYQPRMG